MRQLKPDRDTTQKYRVSTLQELTITLFITSLIFISIYIGLNQYYGWISIPNSRAIASEMSTIGTLVLAWITFQTVRQNRSLIQQQRLQIQNQQARSQPTLRLIGDFEEGSQKDNIRFKLENAGNGAAYNIRFRTDILIPPLGVNSAPNAPSNITSDSPIPSLKSNLSSVHTDNDTLANELQERGELLPENSTKEFECRVDFENEEQSLLESMPSRDLGDEPEFPPTIRFTPLVNALKKTDVETIGIQFVLSYEDVFRNTHNHTFMPRVVFVNEIESVDDLWDSTPLVNFDDNKMQQISFDSLTEDEYKRIRFPKYE